MSQPQKRDWLKGRRKERADALFLVYWQMGGNRSLEKLAELCQTLRIKMTAKTLGRYSSDFGWQQRLLEIQSKESERREKEAGKIVDQMNEQHALMARGIRGLALAGLRHYQERIKKTSDVKRQLGEPADPSLDMSLNDLLNLARGSQVMERMARGQATSRTEVWVDIAATVVREFVLIFMAVNTIEDPQHRATEYLRLGDEMMSRYYSDAVKGRVTHAEISYDQNGA